MTSDDDQSAHPGKIPDPEVAEAELRSGRVRTTAGDLNTDTPAPGEQASLGDRATSGVLWSVAQRWAVRIGGLLTVVILARLLTPEDFGLVAVATAFAPIIYLLSDLGFSTYVVQVERISSRILSTAFWYALAAGVVLCAVVVLLAPTIAAAFHLPAVAPVLIGISPTIILVALSSVPVAVLRRKLAFRELAVQSFIAGLLGQVVAVVLALSGFGVWALVAQLLANQLTVTVLAWIFSRFRPTWEFSWSHFVTMFRFGASVIAIEFTALGRFWAETAIIAAILGVDALGYLNIAQRLIQATQDLSAAAVVPVSTVVFAQIRSSAQRLLAAYQRALETIYVLVMPVMVALAICTPLIIPIMFGAQWTASIAPAQALAIAGIFTLGASLDNGLCYGVGRPGRWLVYAVVIDVITVGTTAVLARHGLLAVALGFVGVAVLATTVRWVLVARLLDAGTARVAQPFLAAGAVLVPSAAAGIGCFLVARQLEALWATAIVSIVVALVHVLTVRIALPAQFRYTVDLLKRRFKRPPTAAAESGGAGSDLTGDSASTTPPGSSSPST